MCIKRYVLSFILAFKVQTSFEVFEFLILCLFLHLNLWFLRNVIFWCENWIVIIWFWFIFVENAIYRLQKTFSFFEILNLLSLVFLNHFFILKSFLQSCKMSFFDIRWKLCEFRMIISWNGCYLLFLIFIQFRWLNFISFYL